jgi:type II secretory pathway component PulJ
MPRNDEAGFSLLETIIAFAIAAAALAALVEIYTSSGSATRKSLEMLKAVEIADREIAALADPVLLAPGLRGPVAEDGLVWQVEILPEPEEENAESPLVLLHVAFAARRSGTDEPVLQVETARYMARQAAGVR